MLTEAGIAEAHAFAAVSSGDNSNIISARVARETFGVENVVARIYDPGRAEVYQRLGISTVATVRWTADQMIRRMLPEEASRCGATPREPYGSPRCTSGRAGSAAREPPGGGIRRASGVPHPYGEGLLPDEETVIQDGDLVNVMMRTADQADRGGPRTRSGG